MPSFHSPELEKAIQLNEDASVMFDQGTAAAHVGDTYVRFTVLFASVLFLISVASRFKVRKVRVATLGLSFVLLGYSVIQVAGLPRL